MLSAAVSTAFIIFTATLVLARAVISTGGSCTVCHWTAMPQDIIGDAVCNHIPNTIPDDLESHRSDEDVSDIVDVGEGLNLSLDPTVEHAGRSIASMVWGSVKQLAIKAKPIISMARGMGLWPPASDVDGDIELLPAPISMTSHYS